MKPDDFIKTARALVNQEGSGRPRETDLRRAVSTAYYALLHCVAAAGADLLVGGKQADRSERAWRQAYRALNHGRAKSRCKEITGKKQQTKWRSTGAWRAMRVSGEDGPQPDAGWSPQPPEHRPAWGC